MNRTRLLFFAIVLSALAFAWFIVRQPQPEDVGTATTTADQPAPGDAVELLVASSSTKQAWMERVAADFMASSAGQDEDGPIRVTVKSVSSGGSTQAILDGRLQPSAWSPGSDAWSGKLENEWLQRHGKAPWSEACRPSIYSPLGIAMWRPMAEALGWPQRPIGWKTLVDLAAAPEGWQKYGHPEWGKFRLGHAHPKYGNSGLLTVTSLVYGMLGKTSGLTADEVYGEHVEQGLRSLAQNTAKYGVVTEDLVDLMVRQGPGYLHAIATYESDTVRMNLQQGDRMRFPVVFVFPAEGAFWGDHPYCVLDQGGWVGERQARAAWAFFEFLTERQQQELAIDFLLRPLDSAIPLRAPLDLANGTDPQISVAQVPALSSPPAEISDAVIDLFMITKRKASVLLVLDTSGSMSGTRLRTASEATVEFLQRLQPADQVGLYTFNQQIQRIAEPRPVSEIGEQLASRIATLIADGSTALHEAVCQAAATMNELRQQDQRQGRNRLYGIVLLSDGEDTVGNPSANQMFTRCLPADAEADGVKIFPIAFGNEANQSVLQRIAQVTGGRLFTADPESITRTYLKISAEQ